MHRFAKSVRHSRNKPRLTGGRLLAEDLWRCIQSWWHWSKEQAKNSCPMNAPRTWGIYDKDFRHWTVDMFEVANNYHCLQPASYWLWLQTAWGGFCNMGPDLIPGCVPTHCEEQLTDIFMDPQPKQSASCCIMKCFERLHISSRFPTKLGPLLFTYRTNHSAEVSTRRLQPECCSLTSAQRPAWHVPCWAAWHVHSGQIMLLEHTEPLLLTLLTCDITSHVTHRCWSYSRPQRVRLQERSSWHYNRRIIPAALWQKGFTAQVLGSSDRRANPPLRHLADGGGPPVPAMSRFYRSAAENNLSYRISSWFGNSAADDKSQPSHSSLTLKCLTALTLLSQSMCNDNISSFLTLMLCKITQCIFIVYQWSPLRCFQCGAAALLTWNSDR